MRWLTRDSDAANWGRVATTVHIFFEARVATQWEADGLRWIFRAHMTRSQDGAAVTLVGTLHAGVLGPEVVRLERTLPWTATTDAEAPTMQHQLVAALAQMVTDARRRAVVG